MSDTLEILHMSKRDRKKKCIRAIKNAITVSDEIAELAWAVTKQAILDIGWTSVAKNTAYNRKINYTVNRTHDSRNNIKRGGLDFWLDILNIEIGFFMKILQHYKLI